MFDDTGPGGRRPARNVLGGELKSCSHEPITGYFRDGCCNTGPGDLGVHTVCAVMTDEFLKFALSTGNDLSTPRPEFDFTGLKAGDQWCLCVSRWREAYEAGKAPRVRLDATHEASLALVTLEALKSHAI